MLANSVIPEELGSDNSGDESCVQMVPYSSQREAQVRGTEMNRGSNLQMGSFNTAKDSFTSVVCVDRPTELADGSFIVRKSKSSIASGSKSSIHSLDKMKSVLDKTREIQNHDNSVKNDLFDQILEQKEECSDDDIEDGDFEINEHEGDYNRGGIRDTIVS